MPPPFGRNAVIHALFTSPEVQELIDKMHPADLRQDLRQEMFLTLCEMDEGRLQAMHESNFLRNYLSGMCRNMAKSDRSTFYRKFRKEREKMLHGNVVITTEGQVQYLTAAQDESTSVEGGIGFAAIITPPELMEQQLETERDYIAFINEAMSQLHPYEQDLIRAYVAAGYNCKPIAEGADIPERSVRLGVANARKKLKKALRK